MEGRTESRRRVQENRATSEGVGRGKSSRRNAKTCNRSGNSQVSSMYLL